jgi:molybdopterin-guanine dinucleotide biosynthesis protein A
VGYDAVAARDGEYTHPLTAAYRTELADTAQRLITEERMRPLYLIEECNSRVVEMGEVRGVDPELNAFRNVNTPEQYREALAAAGLEAN